MQTTTDRNTIGYLHISHSPIILNYSIEIFESYIHAKY